MSKVEEKFIKELNKEYDIILGFQEYEKQIADLKAKLAEKDKEIEDCKRNELYEENMKILAVKNQNQLAIQELEKVKNFVDGRTYCADYIKKRIKELEGK